MTQWMKRHKILTFLLVLLLLSSCGAVVGEDTESETPAEKQPAAKPKKDLPSPSSTASASPTEEATASAEPTPRELWVANYEEGGRPYLTTVATALAVRPRAINAMAGSLNSCRLMGKERRLDKRVAQIEKSFGLKSAPTYERAVAALSATTTSICPEFATFHQSQVAERTKRLRAEERRRNEEERRRRQREARAAEEKAAQEYVYYENCTAVENAGAAPIYAGDPGYSRDLDRDGDGVACEQ